MAGVHLVCTCRLYRYRRIITLNTIRAADLAFSPADPAETPAKLRTPPISLLDFAPRRFSRPMDTQEIQAVHAVLHLISHRNKNQHQRAKWWKWLARLKRTAVELGSQNASTTIPAAYKQYLSTHLIPRCYLYVLLSSTSTGRTLAPGDGRAART